MRAVPSIFYAAIATLLLGCSDSTGPSETPAVRNPGAPEGLSFQVAPSTATLQLGEFLPFRTTYAGNPALSRGAASVAWHSSDESIATVSRHGLVRGVSAGQAQIVATWGAYQAFAVVTVIGPWIKHPDPTVCLKRDPADGQLRAPGC